MKVISKTQLLWTAVKTWSCALYDGIVGTHVVTCDTETHLCSLRRLIIKHLKNKSNLSPVPVCMLADQTACISVRQKQTIPLVKGLLSLDNRIVLVFFSFKVFGDDSWLDGAVECKLVDVESWHVCSRPPWWPWTGASVCVSAWGGRGWCGRWQVTGVEVVTVNLHLKR